MILNGEKCWISQNCNNYRRLSTIMVALIFCGDLKYCPYINRYIERLEITNSEYRVLFWNRGGFHLDLPENYCYYDTSSDLNNGKLKKALDFFRFKKWVLDKLDEIMPDKVIALSTLTGVLLGSRLYKGKVPYIFDIRDYSYEHIYPFYLIEKKVIMNSVFTAISSKGFMEFLPEHDYVIAHNFNRSDIREKSAFTRYDTPIHFVWNGVVRYFEYQKQYLDALKNDPRFEIVFHGDGPELKLYQSYCQENGFKNVAFTGTYNNKDKARLLETAGILNNCYGYTKNAGNKVKYAVSNRFYDGMIYHIPQLVEPDGYKTKWAMNSGIGVTIPVDENFSDNLYEYYVQLDNVRFDRSCSAELTEVLAEDDKYIGAIHEFIIA